MRKRLAIFFFCCSFLSLHAQHNGYTDSLRPSFNKDRFWLVTAANAALWTGSYIALSKAWYAGYPRSSFHFFNDIGEWQQMDKMGHMWTTYQISRLSKEMWQWSGIGRRTSIWLGGLSGIAYQGIIEIQDGFSSEWGFSWTDMMANAIGASAFVSQALAWHDQRVQIKMSYWGYGYPAGLTARRNQLFGTSLPERMLKDYNSQTYWLNFNPHSFFPESHLPRWLNLSIGYSAEGMLGARENRWTDKNGVAHDRTDIERMRRWFLSADIDLTKIPVHSRFLRSAFFVLNMIKIPAPAIELNSKGQFRAHGLYY